jgi:hypothetical protein
MATAGLLAGARAGFLAAFRGGAALPFAFAFATGFAFAFATGLRGAARFGALRATALAVRFAPPRAFAPARFAATRFAGAFDFFAAFFAFFLLGMGPEDTASTARRGDASPAAQCPVGAPGRAGVQMPIVQTLGATQSAADWHGNAHFPYCVLQWCVPQIVSFWQGNASGPGAAIVPDPTGAGAGPGAGAG